MSTFKQWQEKETVILLDGAMSTGLETRGIDLNDPLWTAKALLESPEKISQVHQSYFDEGANIAITNSYQATTAGFAKLGFSKAEGQTFIKQTVLLAQEARQASQTAQAKWIAGSVGPYGAFLADGSEYRGNYGKSREELLAFHRERIALLAEAEVDLFACETIPDRTEIEALVTLLAEYPTIPAWLTVSMKNPHQLSDGTPLAEFQALAEASEAVLAYGVNCVQPEWVTPILEQLQVKGTKPFVVYPNSGAEYDAVTKTWTSHPATAHFFTREAKKWQQLGAKFIGGCCCTTEQEISCLHQTFADLL